MYDKKNVERLALISSKINKILEICKNGIVKSLNDELRDRPAILMHLIASNEQLQKIQDSGDVEILKLFSREDIMGLRGIRNATAHDYEGVNLETIEEVIRNHLPTIKDKIDNFISNKAMKAIRKQK